MKQEAIRRDAVIKNMVRLRALRLGENKRVFGKHQSVNYNNQQRKENYNLSGQHYGEKVKK
jgi:hypothetical protein